MKLFENVEDINKYLRELLIQQSELSPKFVLNALSTYGTDLDKIYQEEIYNSIEPNDSVILFQLISRDSLSDMSQEEDKFLIEPLRASNLIKSGRYFVSDNYLKDEDITNYKCYRLKIIIYGDNSNNLAIKLAARMRTQKVRTTLYDKGIYLEKVEDPIIVNEFKNETMWIRNDLNIDVGINQKIKQIETDEDYDFIGGFKIIED